MLIVACLLLQHNTYKEKTLANFLRVMGAFSNIAKPKLGIFIIPFFRFGGNTKLRKEDKAMLRFFRVLVIALLLSIGQDSVATDSAQTYAVSFEGSGGGRDT